ncbi:MAG: NAD(P)H-hydrate dehydratase [Bacteroidales bacterium]
MKLFLTGQIRDLDRATLEEEHIASVELMDRAADAITTGLIKHLTPTLRCLILAGPGNNGGDALAVALRLIQKRQPVTVLLCTFGKTMSADARIQLDRLRALASSSIKTWTSEVPENQSFDLLVDGLFGSGLNRPLSDEYVEVIQWINAQQKPIYSIDVPSGMFGENNASNNADCVVRKSHCICLEMPRIACLLPENEVYVQSWEKVPIGLSKQAQHTTESPYHLTEREDIQTLLKDRTTFAHKGQMGRILMIAGSEGMAGAAILSARGALRSGCGLLTVATDPVCLPSIQSAVAEAMCKTFQAESFVNDEMIHSFTAVGIGPGLGCTPTKKKAFAQFLKKKPQRLLLDADALNMLAEDSELLLLLPHGSILTPHPGEFDRLSQSKPTSGYERLQTARSFATKHQVYVVLKGAYTACILPDGNVHFNSTGNPGMATGGSGDVLSGIIVSLLGQGYSQTEACQLGCFLHGLAADLALETQSVESLLAGDIPSMLGRAFQYIRSNH